MEYSYKNQVQPYIALWEYPESFLRIVGMGLKKLWTELKRISKLMIWQPGDTLDEVRNTKKQSA